MPHILTTTYFDDSPPLAPPMLSYESSTSSSSGSGSSPPSPYAHRHRLRRKRSPSPSSRHVSQPYSHHFLPTSRPYSPSSREADIARLLDPSYASPATHSALKSSKTAIKEMYVDHHGDLHDPDFRDFPTFGNNHMHSRQSRWEHTYGDEEDEDDEEEEIEQRRHSFEAQRRRPSSSINYHSTPVYYPHDEPASYESRYLAEDEEEDTEQHEHAPLKEKHFSLCSRSSEKRPKSQDEKPAPTEGAQVIQGDSEWTPTCTQSLRRQWQAIALSLRFSLFRTKRRLRRRMTG